MADKIRLLPEVVANQIAAGEVVNRPSSVVKEMMENAIDAGARSVKVNYRDGGKELIQIVDDGCGMSPIDARMAFDRHATSKIRSVDDIYALRTFGFRGEALASIAAVAQVELRTRQEGDEVGTVTEINGGQFVAQTPAMCPVGSQFFVRNLFYNVPARRRFLEKGTTSASQIKAEFQRVALCNPSVAFELYANDAPILSLAAASLAGRIVDVVGRHIKQNLLDVEADTSIARIEGYIGRPAAAKKRNTEQYLFVNGRYFKSSYLTSAILKAYEKLIPESSQPSYFLYLTIDPGRIDVNVHPQKTEVKFADEEAVWQIVHAAVRETLARTGAVPMMDFDREGQVEIPVLQRGAIYSEPRAMSNEDYNPFRETYIDPSAPDPNVDFTGFDVPYADGGMVSDTSGAGFRAGGVRTAAPGPSAGGGFRLPQDGEFEEFESGADFGSDRFGYGGGSPSGGIAGELRNRIRRDGRGERARFHSVVRRGGAAAFRSGAGASRVLGPAAAGGRLPRRVAERALRRRGPAARPRTDPLRGLPPDAGQRLVREPAIAVSRAARAVGRRIRPTRGERRGVRRAGIRHRLLRRRGGRGEGHARRTAARCGGQAAFRAVAGFSHAFVGGRRAAREGRCGHGPRRGAQHAARVVARRGRGAARAACRDGKRQLLALGQGDSGGDHARRVAREAGIMAKDRYICTRIGAGPAARRKRN